MKPSDQRTPGQWCIDNRNKQDCATQAKQLIGQPVAFEIRRGVVRIATIVQFSLSGGNDGGWLAHFELEFRGRRYFRSAVAIAA